VFGITTFEEDQNGEIYFGKRGNPEGGKGTIYKLIMTNNEIVWVDFGDRGLMNGSQTHPFNNLKIAVESVINRRVISIDGDSQVTTSNETMVTIKSVTTTSINGSISVGVPSNYIQRFPYIKGTPIRRPYNRSGRTHWSLLKILR